jgi:glycosyltransferase involved in cell wall biosynthesis
MPKLLNVNNYHYRRGGSESIYFEHASLMEKHGWSNGFFSMHHPLNLPTPWSRFFVEELEFGRDYSLVQQVVNASKVVFSFEAQRKLNQLLEAFPADIAHLHCIHHHLSPSIVRTLHTAGIPTVMTAHDLKIACPAYKMLNQTGVCERCKTGSLLNVVKHRCIKDSLGASAVVMLESSLHRLLQTYQTKLSRIVVPSRFFLEKFVEWGWSRDSFVYIPNFVDAGLFEPAYDASDYVLYFGRLAPEKGLQTLIDAAAKSRVKLKVVGTGPMEAQLKALQVSLNLDVEFLGYKTGSELHGLIRAARATVLPSEWYENAPMSILESYALGTPVLGARIGGIPEMLRQGETGWSFRSADVDDLASVLATVAAAPASLLEKMGRSARAYVSATFSRERYSNAMAQLYGELGVR